MDSGKQSAVTRFIATTPGLSATRWLAFILASHPDVFVAHGHFPLDSVFRNHFRDEKEKGDLPSLTIGGDMAPFYQSRSVAEVFDAYSALNPDARAMGNIHSYTLDVLMHRVEKPEELDDISIVNILRHPVSYLDSHFSLVRSAEAHPQLYRHYAENVFSDALRRFPELFLLDCANYREFLAFAVSCLSVCNMERDFNYAHFRQLRHFRMELLTADARSLQDFCETLTGFNYPLDGLEFFIVEGPINRHRKGRPSTDPQTIYSAWPDWKKDMAAMMISSNLLDRFEEHGYDVGMLRSEATTEISKDVKPAVPCLADRLRVIDEHHPMLALLGEISATQPRIYARDYNGYSLIEFAGKVYGFPNTLGSISLPALSAETLYTYQQRDDCFVGTSIEEVQKTILKACELRPRLLQGDFYGFNLVEYRGQCFALSSSLGPIDLPTVLEDELKEYLRRGDCFVRESIDEVRQLIASTCDEGMPMLLEGEFSGFNLVAFQQQIYGLACTLGPIDLTTLPGDSFSEYLGRGDCFIGTSVKEVKEQILMAVDFPLLVEEGYGGFNIVRYGNRFYALAWSLGVVDLAQLTPEVLDVYQQRAQCFVAKTVEEVKRSVDQTLESVSGPEA
jgi:hypothetical protein